jgi:FtsZ-binding cell division protein ZapB
MSEDIEFFKSEVKQFDQLELEIKEITSTIKPLNAKLKELKSKKSEIQGNICEYMAKNEIDECNTKNGKLIYKESKTVKPLTQSDIKESITTYFGNLPDNFNKLSCGDKANSLIEFIYDSNRVTTVKTSVKSKQS